MLEESEFDKLTHSRWLYHSGLSEPVRDSAEQIAKRTRGDFAELPDRRMYFWTKKYDATYTLSLRSNAEGNFNTDRMGTHALVAGMHRWEFLLPQDIFGNEFKFKLLLNGTFWQAGNDRKPDWYGDAVHLGDNEVVFGYEIHFWTDLWRPAHLITARTSVDGVYRDIFGTFGRVQRGRWDFVFEYDQYPASFEARLVLDRSVLSSPNIINLNTSQPIVDFDDTSLTFAATPSAFTHPYENFVSIESDADQRLVRSFPRESGEYDVIVLGSGMGGGVLADTLSDLGHRVLVIEAGGIRYPVHMYELPREDRDPVQRDRLGHYDYQCTDWFDGGVTFNLGGRSVYWSGLIPRMAEWEFRDAWPRSIRNYFMTPGSDGLTGYEQAEKVVRARKRLGPYQDQVVAHLSTALPTFETSDLPQSLHQPNITKQPMGIELDNVLTRSTGCFSTADLLLDSLGHNRPAGNHNLRVALHHFITHLEHSNDSVTSVVCQDLIARQERKYRGKYVVLCCGSVESPKIAINSGLTDPNEMFGKGFSDHPAYFYQRKHRLPTSGPLAWLGASDGHAKLLIRHTGATASHHPYHIEVLINGRYWDLRHADNELEEGASASNAPAEVELKFIFDSELIETNRIESYGTQQKVNIRIHPNLARNCYKPLMIEVRNQVLTALGVPSGELSTEWKEEEWSEGIKGTVHHAGGSLRCSATGGGVVDEDLKFEAYNNLYCCDVSVYPSIPAANPSLTLVGLAQRLAGQLSSRLKNASSATTANSVLAANE